MCADTLCESGDSGYRGGETREAGGESRKMLCLGFGEEKASLVLTPGEENGKRGRSFCKPAVAASPTALWPALDGRFPGVVAVCQVAPLRAEAS